MRHLFLLGLALVGCGEAATGGDRGASGAPADCPGGKCDGADDRETFEFVVIGSGAGGGPLAANLARAGHRVLLLEAGEDAGHKLAYQVPSFHPIATEEPGLAWSYYVNHYEDEAQAKRDTKLVYEAGRPKGVLYPRGGTLGGSTAVNAMITVYPHESDWDQIAEITGDSSWSGANMRRYFQRLERNGYVAARTRGATGHGYAGWLSVERFPLTRAIGDLALMQIAAGAARGYVDGAASGLFDFDNDVGELLGLLKRDMNEWTSGRDAREGLFSVPKATRGGQRNGTREYILETVQRGFPLTVRTKSLATRVLFDEGQPPRAIGVEYLAGASLYRADPRATGAEQGTPTQVFASREVVVSAGAFNTPQILKLSGVGPKEELARHGIATVVDLPGVGENLQDRYEVGIVYELEDDFALLDGCTFGRPGDPCLAEWADDEGAYPSNGAAFGVIKRSGTAERDPDLFVFGAPGVFKGYYPGYSRDAIADKRHFTWIVLKAHTANRAGRVTLRSADPRDTPRVDFRYFAEGDTGDFEDWNDVQAVVDGVEMIRDIGRETDDLMVFNSFREVWPGERKVQTREQIAQFVEDEAWGHHASCTAKIGADDDPMAVLDAQFRVRGTQGLRVVDASIFPRIPGFFIVVPVYMISEKATDAILASLAETRH